MNTSGIMQVLYMMFCMYTVTKAQMTVDYDAVEDARREESCCQGNRNTPQESTARLQKADIEGLIKGLIDSSLQPILSLLQQLNSTINSQCQGNPEGQLEACQARNMLDFGTSCYYFERELEKNMADSRKYCKSTYGADLVSVESSEERDFLVRNLTESPGSTGSVWISLKSVLDTNHTAWYWTSTNETLHGFTDWGQGEPNNYNHTTKEGIRLPEECVIMWAVHGYQWNDTPCDGRGKVGNFICELML